MEEIITRTLNRFDIVHLRNRLVAELSGGEKQRVALAAVMVHKPPILILDEPDSFLDLKGRQALETILQQLRTESPDMILIRITQFTEVARLYNRMILFHQGSIIARGHESMFV